MFKDFANVWTAIGMARDFPAGRPHAITVAGERVVLFRDPAGALCALIDRCPHRGVALSLGKIHDGVIECPFHGWRFDGQGHNCLVPWNPDARRDVLGATALPVREIGGLAWLHTGPVAQTEPQVPALLRDPAIKTIGLNLLWDVHWTRAMENMLDSPHLPFVHKGSIGRGMARLVKAGGRMDVSWTPVDHGAEIANHMEGQDRPGRLDYRYPNAMELHIDPPGRRFRILSVCLPVNDRQTMMGIYPMRDFMTSRLFDPLFRWSNRRVAREDQAVLESSQPLAIPPSGEERSVRTDAPTLAFRKLYFEKLAGSTAVPPA